VTSYSNELREAKLAWDQRFSDLPETVAGFAQRPVLKSALSEWFGICIENVSRIEASQPDEAMLAIHWDTIKTAIDNIKSQVNGSPLERFIPDIHANLWTIRSASPWLLTVPDINPAAMPKLSEVSSHAERIEKTARMVEVVKQDVVKLLASARSSEEELKERVTSIEGFERTASNANTNAEASATQAKASERNAEDAAGSIANDLASQKALLTEFETKRTFVDETLEGASKVALANAFATRRVELTASLGTWIGAFSAGLALMVIVAGVLVKYPADIWWQEIPRVLVLSPILWGTWFAARKYGQLSRLTEDYAFKEAAAHAFVGYRREMGDDAEMLHLLRRYAIKNFGANPVRVLSDNEPSSPMHALVDKAAESLDKLSTEQISELMKEIAKAVSSNRKG
jgi:hypothetical protein